MKSNYQKYYNDLKGKDFLEPINSYKSALNDSKSKMTSMQSLLSSSENYWNEKGLNKVKNTIMPELNSEMDTIEEGIAALANAASKVNTLVSYLDELNTLEEKLSTLGSKWTYTEGGTRSKTEVNNHNYSITQTETKIAEKEKEIETLINEIKSISVPTLEKIVTDNKVEETEKVETEEKEETKEKKAKVNNKEYNSNPAINQKIKELIGDVDDPNSYEEVKDNFRSMRKDILVIDPETGKTYNRDDIIELKEGETKRLIVRLPVDTGMIDTITRTSADNCGSRITKTYSDVDPDPNKVQYVRRSSNHWPDDMSLLHNNCYEWVITSTGGTGTKTLSQTVEYTTNVSNGTNLKAMTRLRVNVTRDSDNNS